MKDYPGRSLLVNLHKKANISLLSTEAESPNYRGFLNLGAIILIAVNFRLVIENILKYGLLLHRPQDLINDYASLEGTLTYISYSVPVTLAYLIETRFADNISGIFVRFLQFLIQVWLLTLPLFSIYYYKVQFIPASMLLGLTLIISMKVYSFASVIYEAREAYKSKEYLKYPAEFKAIIAKYPNIITFKYFCYFMLTPTLCFQFKYPYTQGIRKVWLFKRIVEYIVSLSLMLVIVQQYITPLIKNAIKVIDQDQINYISLLERHLKLAIPNLYLWLFIFYSNFQCSLNILAEITGFADREFYKEWWNSRTLGEYWRTWNLPVHNWLSRHVYFPMVDKGYSKTFSMFCVFTFSAIAHEYLISGACRILTYWAFIAMMAQIPMIVCMDLFKSQLEKSQIGNVVFWVSFCMIGQPVAVLIYSYQALTSSNLS